MPTLKGPIQFTGTIDELIAYKTKNSDKIIVRRKPFISKDAYKKAPQYAAMRQNSAEFTGAAYAGKMVRMALGPLIQLADYNMTPALNSFCRAIQQRDTLGKRGQRAICFSTHKEAFGSLVFTKQYLFDSIFKQRPVAELLREKAELHIQLDELVPGFNFYLPWNKAYFRIIGCIGAIEDVHFTEKGYDKRHQQTPLPNATVYSDWMPSGKKVNAHSMMIRLPKPELLQQETTSLLGAIGIQMGQAGLFGEINPVKYASTARILAGC